MNFAPVKAWLKARSGQQSTLYGIVIGLAGAWLWHRGLFVKDLGDLGFMEAVAALCVWYNETPAAAVAQIKGVLDELPAIQAALPSADAQKPPA